MFGVLPFDSVVDPWFWLSFGTLLLLLELLIPGYFLLSFGIAAFMMAAASAAMPSNILSGETWETFAIFTFWAFLGLLIWFLIAHFFTQSRKRKKDINHFTAHVEGTEHLEKPTCTSSDTSAHTSDQD